MRCEMWYCLRRCYRSMICICVFIEIWVCARCECRSYTVWLKKLYTENGLIVPKPTWCDALMFFPERRRNHGPWPVGSLAGLAPSPLLALTLSQVPLSLGRLLSKRRRQGVAPPPPCPTLGPPLPPRPRPSTGRGWSRVGIHIHLYWLVSPSSLQFAPWGLFFVCCEQWIWIHRAV